MSETGAFTLLNLETGATRNAENSPESAGIELSSTGRWYLEILPSLDTAERRLRIVDTESGQVQFDFDVSGNYLRSWFSPDDTLFVCATSNKYGGTDSRLQIWRTNPPRFLHQFEAFETPTPAFSPDGRRIAAETLENEQRKLVVFDVESGTRLKEVTIERQIGLRLVRSYNDETLWFTADGSSVLYAEHSNLILAWNLSQNEVVAFPEHLADPRKQLRFAPSRSTPPQLVGDDKCQLYDVPSGRLVMSLSEDCQYVDLSADGKTLIVDQYRQSSLEWFLRFLSSLQVPVPQSIWWMARESSNAWLFVDVPSGNVRTQISAPIDHWLSHDEQTLVTLSSWDSAAIDVWDFPPRTSIIGPAAWSLIWPGLMLLWWRWRDRRVTASRSRERSASESHSGVTLLRKTPLTDVPGSP